MICSASIKHSPVPVHKTWSASITYILANPYICFVCQYNINNCLVCQYIKKNCHGRPTEYFRWYCLPVQPLFLTDASTRLHCSPVHICTGMRIGIFMIGYSLGLTERTISFHSHSTSTHYSSGRQTALCQLWRVDICHHVHTGRP